MKISFSPTPTIVEPNYAPESTGTPPPGYYYGASISVGDIMYVCIQGMGNK